MNTPELIKAIVEKVEGGTQTSVKAHLIALEEVVEETLAKGENVSISGFVGYEVKDIPPTERKNPQTGEKFLKEATRKVKVKIGSRLANCVK